jgi:Ni,Fe-hydrogenase I small subunit
MEAKNGKKARDILKAIAAGYSCEQILASDGTVTRHDIFHVVAETPTSFWRKASARSADTGLTGGATSIRRPKNRRD